MSVGKVVELLALEITWSRVQAETPKWIAEVGGERCKLRMNDFPDEPLYTVELKGDFLDIDDPPAMWTIPHS